MSQTIQIEGTTTTDIGTSPLSVTQPVVGPGGSLVIETVNEDETIVTGRLPNEPYLEYMRSVGVGVNDFSITFVATRTS